MNVKDDWCWFQLKPFTTFVEPTMACFITKESGYFNLTHFEQRIANKLLIHPRCIWNLLAHFVVAIKLKPLHIVWWIVMESNLYNIFFSKSSQLGVTFKLSISREHISYLVRHSIHLTLIGLAISLYFIVNP